MDLAIHLYASLPAILFVDSCGGQEEGVVLFKSVSEFFGAVINRGGTLKSFSPSMKKDKVVSASEGTNEPPGKRLGVYACACMYV